MLDRLKNAAGLIRARSGAATQQWIDQQKGSVQTFEKVQHVMLAEQSGELYCTQCHATQQTKANHGMRFEVLVLHQLPAFERFAEQHLHGITL